MMFKILSICKGGGYHYCRTSPRHPKANAKGLYPLHRVLAENKLGRLLQNGEDVHHVNENKMDDDPDNLEVLTKSAHAKKHGKKLPLVIIECGNCGKPISICPHVARQRVRRSKHGKIFCSLHCSGLGNNQKK